MTYAPIPPPPALARPVRVKPPRQVVPKGMVKANCRCPAGAKRVSTNGRGRGWNCQGPKLGKWRPFVPSVCDLVPKPGRR